MKDQKHLSAEEVIRFYFEGSSFTSSSSIKHLTPSLWGRVCVWAEEHQLTITEMTLGFRHTLRFNSKVRDASAAGALWVMK